MDRVRIGAAVVSVLLAIALGLAVIPALDGGERVDPTGGVMNGPADDLPGAELADTLKARTALQQWRAISGPAPDAEAGRAAVR